MITHQVVVEVFLSDLDLTAPPDMGQVIDAELELAQLNSSAIISELEQRKYQLDEVDLARLRTIFL